MRDAPKPFTVENLRQLIEEYGKDRGPQGQLVAALAKKVLDAHTAYRTLEREVQRVLVVLEGDGEVSVFTDSDRVAVKLVHMPATLNAAATAIGEEEVIGRLPLPYRLLWEDRSRIANGNIRACPTVASLQYAAQTRQWVQLLGELERITNGNSKRGLPGQGSVQPVEKQELDSGQREAPPGPGPVADDRDAGGAAGARPQ